MNTGLSQYGYNPSAGKKRSASAMLGVIGKGAHDMYSTAAYAGHVAQSALHSLENAKDAGLAITTAVLTRQHVLRTLATDGPELVEGILEGAAIMTALATQSTMGNSGGVSSSYVSPEVPPTPPVATVPGTPVSPSISLITDNTMTLTWLPPTSDGGSPLTGYKLHTDDGTGGVVTTLYQQGAANVLSAATIGLTPGTVYQWTITAINAIGDSLPSAISSATTTTTPQVPDQPSPVTYSGVTSTDFDIFWTAPFDGWSPILSYDLFIDDGAGGPVTTPLGSVAYSPPQSFFVSGKTPSTTYKIEVRAVNAIGNSINSASTSITTLDPPLTLEASFLADTYDTFVLNCNASLLSTVATTEPLDLLQLKDSAQRLRDLNLSEAGIRAYSYATIMTSKVFPLAIGFYSWSDSMPPVQSGIKQFPRFFLGEQPFIDSDDAIFLVYLDKTAHRAAYKNMANATQDYKTSFLDDIAALTSGTIHGETVGNVLTSLQEHGYGVSSTGSGSMTSAVVPQFLGVGPKTPRVTTPALYTDIGTGHKWGVGTATTHAYPATDFVLLPSVLKAREPSILYETDFDLFCQHPAAGALGNPEYGQDMSTWVGRKLALSDATPPTAGPFSFNLSFAADLPPTHVSQRTYHWFLDTMFANATALHPTDRYGPWDNTSSTMVAMYRSFFDTYLHTDSNWENLLGRGAYNEAENTGSGDGSSINPGGSGWIGGYLTTTGGNDQQKEAVFGQHIAYTPHQAVLVGDTMRYSSHPGVPYYAEQLLDGMSSVAHLPTGGDLTAIDAILAVGSHPTNFGVHNCVVGLPFYGSCDYNWFYKTRFAILCMYNLYHGSDPDWQTSYVALFTLLYPEGTRVWSIGNTNGSNFQYGVRRDAQNIVNNVADYATPLARFTAISTFLGELSNQPTDLGWDLATMDYIQRTTTTWTQGAPF